MAKTYQVILINGLWKNSPVPQRSIGVYKLAHSLRRRGVTVKVIDFVDKLTARELYAIFDEIQTKETRWVGFGSSFVARYVKRQFIDKDGKKKEFRYSQKSEIPDPIFNFFMAVKQHCPHIKTIVGGVKADVLDADDYECFDYSFTGYSEDAAYQIHQFLSTGSPEPMVKPLPHGCQLISFAPPMVRMPGDVAYDIKHDDFQWHEDDNIQPMETLPLETARGCIFRCKFCSYPELGKKKGQYVRDMLLIENELRQNWERWGVTTYQMLDDTFNDDPDKVEAFRDMSLRLPFRLQFGGYLRCDLLWARPETAVWLKEAGLRGAYFGIESMHPTASRVIGKGWNGGPHSKPFIERLRHEIWGDDVSIFTSYILGLPGENRDSIMESVEWVKKTRIQGASFRSLTMRSETGTYVSEFESNAADYGYTIFRDENGKDSWTNSQDYDLNSRQACAELEMALTFEMLKINHYTIWSLLPLGTIGVDINKAMYIKETDQEFIKKIRDPLSMAWRERYFKSLRAPVA